MNLPLYLTASRLVFAPLFFVTFFVPEWTGAFHVESTVLLWVMMVIIEITDAADGALARALNQVTDLGKLLDPFSDVISRLTYFICFTVAGIMPAWVLIIIFYREYGIVFLRMIMYRDGTALAARKGGKLKAIFYFLSGIIGMLVVTIERTGVLAGSLGPIRTGALVVFAVSAVLCLVSFIDYLTVFRTSRRGAS
ncbi:MAG: CDP-diacylglycerol--glycerol-3-phosphate 3-phosphatidyltransferase [Spirochaetaceae bacterium]|nr:MAG: CDP-diacylglycerol--glycerol-3-phosphate 3-phosphatidyltransferase [Spirochaetaceae bacterium]